jgi:putative transposase
VPVKDDTPVIAKLQELAEKKPKEGQDKFYSRIRMQVSNGIINELREFTSSWD